MMPQFGPLFRAEQGMDMRTPALAAFTLLTLAACNRQESQVTPPDVQTGLDRSVADVRAAEAAAAEPLVPSRSVGEISEANGKKPAPAKG